MSNVLQTSWLHLAKARRINFTPVRKVLWSNLATVLSFNSRSIPGRLEHAKALLPTCVYLCEQFMFDNDQLFEANFMDFFTNLYDFICYFGLFHQFPRSEELLRRAVSLGEQILKEYLSAEKKQHDFDPNFYKAVQYHLMSLANLAGLLVSKGHFEAAECFYLQAHKLMTTPDIRPVSTFTLFNAHTLINLAKLLQLRNHVDAQSICRQALWLAQLIDAPDVTALSQTHLAQLLRQEPHNSDETALLFKNVLDVNCQRFEKGNHPLIASALNKLGSSLMKMGPRRYAEASAIIRRALEIRISLHKNCFSFSAHPETAASIAELRNILASCFCECDMAPKCKCSEQQPKEQISATEQLFQEAFNACFLNYL